MDHIAMNIKELNKMKKASKKTIKVVYNNKGQLDIKEVEAKKFDVLIIDDKIINLYIHRDIINNKKWMITDEGSGLPLERNFKNTVEARKKYNEDLKNIFIDFIKNKYSQYLMAIKNFNKILSNKN